MYSLGFTSEAADNVRQLPKNVRNRLKTALTGEFAEDPVGCSLELREPLAEFRCFHWEKYRIVFKVEEKLGSVAIVGVGLRSPQSVTNVYRRLEALANTGKLAEQMQQALVHIRGFKP